MNQGVDLVKYVVTAAMDKKARDGTDVPNRRSKGNIPTYDEQSICQKLRGWRSVRHGPHGGRSAVSMLVVVSGQLGLTGWVAGYVTGRKLSPLYGM